MKIIRQANAVSKPSFAYISFVSRVHTYQTYTDYRKSISCPERIGDENKIMDLDGDLCPRENLATFPLLQIRIYHRAER